jgi:hypothetical protein
MLLPRLGAGSLAQAEEGSERQEDGADTTIVLMAPARRHGRQRHRSRPPRPRPRRRHRESRGMAPSRGTPWRRSNGRRRDTDCGEDGASAATAAQEAGGGPEDGERRKKVCAGGIVGEHWKGEVSERRRTTCEEEPGLRVVKKGRGDRALCVLRYFFSMKGSAR